jgi:hypothetical protein
VKEIEKERKEQKRKEKKRKEKIYNIGHSHIGTIVRVPFAMNW